MTMIVNHYSNKCCRMTHLGKMLSLMVCSFPLLFLFSVLLPRGHVLFLRFFIHEKAKVKSYLFRVVKALGVVVSNYCVCVFTTIVATIMTARVSPLISFSWQKPNAS